MDDFLQDDCDSVAWQEHEKAESIRLREEVPEAEMERRRAVMKDLMEETERLGLYR